MKHFACILGLLILSNTVAFGQIKLGGSNDVVDYTLPKKYEIAGISVAGTDKLDPNGIIAVSKLSIGQKVYIPGDEVSAALRALWAQSLFENVQIEYEKVQGEYIWLRIRVTEQPRLSRIKYKGMSKGETDNVREELELFRGKIINKNLIFTTRTKVKRYFVDKGFLNAKVDVVQKADSNLPGDMFVINVIKGKKVKIHKIHVHHNTALSDSKVKRAMKETKEVPYFRPFSRIDTLMAASVSSLYHRDRERLSKAWSTHMQENVRVNIFKSSKFVSSNYRTDKKTIIEKYNQKGYRDARLLSDTVYDRNDREIEIELEIYEGPQYRFRNITWVGNTLRSSAFLDKVLGIRKGDVYNPSLLERKLFADPNGQDILSLFMDDGYLSFQLNPVEVAIENDSIDIEIRMYEGRQFYINQVSVSGNTKTNDHVILREIRTKPGQLFNRSEIIRSQRELSVLGYFDPEQLDIRTNPNTADGTVDLEYVVAERPSDQIELSGGWGGGRIVGTLGVSFNNFSTRNFFKKGAWQPLPAGDGQRLSVRAQTNGTFFQSYNISFTEPWLGGRRPNALSVGAYYSVQSNGQTRKIKDDDGNRVDNPLRQSIDIFGTSVSLARRLRVPDDWFQLSVGVNYQHYTINNWSQFIFDNGESNNAFLKVTVSRDNRGQNPWFPMYGSEMRMSAQITPPYSAFSSQDYSTLSAQRKFRWIEYHKWKFKADWYTNPFDKLVINTRIGFGVLGNYNNDIGTSPFERFYLGGSGLTGFALDGREIIALRGYDDQSVSPTTGGSIINKYTMELRYPFSLNPQATIYGLTFVEGGNTWDSFRSYDPFAVKRSAGFGVRIYLPMFGLLGLDWGYRFDDIPNRVMERSQIHFTIGANLGEL